MTDWVPISDFPGYSVSPLGQVKKNANDRVLKPRLNQHDVPYVGLMREWRQCIRSLPKLVANTFLEVRNEIFDTPIQLDGDPWNCRADNLMWRPWWYAVRYKRQFHEGRYDYPITEPIRCKGDGVVYPDSFTAALRYGLLEEEVVQSVNRRTPTWLTYQYFELVEM